MIGAIWLFGRRRRAAGSGATVCRALSDRFAVPLIRRLLRRLAVGRLVVDLPAGARLTQEAPRPGPSANLVLHRWRALRRLLTGGDLAFGEAYVAGDWSSADLATFIELAALNHAPLGAAVDGSLADRALNRLVHRARSNTPRGSRRNIPIHYDLGNEFYAEWLDRDMIYSSALYSSEGQTLEDAQRTKLDRVIAALDLGGGELVLEIGCGWGALVERLIAEAGCQVVALTLSPSQLAAARARIAAASLTADLRLQDYRDIGGKFDRIVSIEMLEAVGEAFWPAYFTQIRDCLAPGGSAIVQVITIAEERFADYLRKTDFIQQHIFPGGMLPTVRILHEQVAHVGLALHELETFGASYAATLAEWRRRFTDAWPRLHGQGFDEAFRRKWEYYLAYCEGGFRAKAIDVGLYRVTQQAA